MRSIHVLLLAAPFVLLACGSHDPTAKTHGNQTGQPSDPQNPHGTPPSDPPSDDPEQPGGSQQDDAGTPGGGSDGGTTDGGITDGGGGSGDTDAGGGTASCPAAAFGWHAMASETTVSKSGGLALRGNLVWTGHEVIAYGATGACSATTCAEGEVAAYDPHTDTWRLLPALPAGTPIVRMNAFWTGTKYLLAPTVFTSSSKILSLDLATSTWTELSAGPFAGRSRVVFTWVPSTHELFAYGGINDDVGYIDDGAMLDPDTGAWRSIGSWPEPTAYPRRENQIAIYTGGKILFGWGDVDFMDDCVGAYRTLFLFDPVAVTWTKIAEPAVLPREGNSMFTLGTTGALVGMGSHAGCFQEGMTLHDGAIFDGTTGTWTTIPDSGLFGNSDISEATGGDTRFGITTFLANNRYFGWGGNMRKFDSPSATPSMWWVNFGDGAYYDLATKTWTKMPDGGPTPRFNAEAVTTDCDVVVYGGLAWSDKSTAQTTTTLKDGMLFRP